MTGECFICGEYAPLEKHHLFGGALRKKSEKCELFVYLCHSCHNEPPNGAHFNKDIMQKLHEYGEKKWLAEHNATIDDFRKEFYKNYI